MQTRFGCSYFVAFFFAIFSRFDHCEKNARTSINPKQRIYIAERAKHYVIWIFYYFHSHLFSINKAFSWCGIAYHLYWVSATAMTIFLYEFSRSLILLFQFFLSQIEWCCCSLLWVSINYAFQWLEKVYLTWFMSIECTFHGLPENSFFNSKWPIVMSKWTKKNRIDLMSACHKSLQSKSQNQMTQSARSSDFTLIFRHLTRKR